MEKTSNNPIIDKSGLDLAIKEKIIRIIKALLPDAKIILYGSRARGTFKERSDIDIALDAERKLKWTEVGEAKDMLEASHISYKIDVVDLNGALSEEMKDNIMKEGVLWSE